VSTVARINTDTTVNLIASSSMVIVGAEQTDDSARIVAILDRRAVRSTYLSEKRLLYMLAQAQARPEEGRDLSSADLYLFDLLTPFRYDWREVVRRLRIAEPNAPIVAVVSAPTGAIIDDGLRVGVDEFLYETEIAFPRLVWQRIGGFLEPALPAPHPALPAERRQSAVPQLHIGAPDLRAPTGRLDAIKIAKQLGVPLARLATVAGVSRQALSQTPDSPGIQIALNPIARALHVLDRSLHPDDQRKWLRASHADLEGKTPLDTIMSGNADAVARLLENM